jgi:hypothetical protein
MQDILRTTDPVLLSVARNVLDQAGIPFLVADQFTAGIEGSIGAFPCRLSVIAEDVQAACEALAAAGLADHLLDTQR